MGKDEKDKDPEHDHFIEIDFKQLKSLCGIQCTKREASAYLGCSDDTLERRIKEKYDQTWGEFFDKHSSSGKVSLRRKQFEGALGGNVTLQIWLGKQYLGQSDKNYLESKTEVKTIEEYLAETKE